MNWQILFIQTIFIIISYFKFYNDELDLKLNIVSKIVKITCNDYSKLKKEDKIIKDTYKLARSIQIICTTDFIDHFIE